MLVCVLSCFSRVRLFVTLWTAAHQAPLSMVHWSLQARHGVGCHAFLQGISTTQGLNLCLLRLLHCRWILYRWASGGAHVSCTFLNVWLHYLGKETTTPLLTANYKPFAALLLHPRFCGGCQKDGEQGGSCVASGIFAHHVLVKGNCAWYETISNLSLP